MTLSRSHSLQPRNVKFDWRHTPQPWLPDDPFTAHFINVLHLLLPEGELWFCRLYNQALPDIADESLRADVKGFVRQEAIHSRSHQVVLDQYFANNGIVTAPFTQRVRWLFTEVLGDQPFGIAPGWQWLARAWLTFRLGLIAAIEHFTCVIGRWILECRGLDEAGADPVMMDLLRWHGAEEVEHRNVAHDLFEARGGGYFYRVGLMLLTGPVLILLWWLGTHFFLRQQVPANARWRFWREWRRAARQDRLPTFSFLLASVWRYLRPGYHPQDEADTETALDYLQRSPAALRATAR